MKQNPKQDPKQDQCTVNERNGQLVFALNNEILLPVNAPARLTSAQLEELDYRKLYRAYSARGKKSKVDPRVLFKVMAYGYQCGIYSSRKLEEACRYRVDFGRRACAGSYNAGTVSDRAVYRGSGGSVLPVCGSFGTAGRNGS